ncbi:MAG: hypothetical protein NC429_05450 [Lachnospiraceae bacterium]|nr:hypothetical protein [Lachnospiraceae bacterium]
MGGILYECRFYFHFVVFAPLIMLVAMILLFVFLSRKLKREGAPALGIKIVKIFFLSAIIFSCIINILGLIFRIDLYNKTVAAYQNGDYQIVEGYVENFEPMGNGGFPPEKFEINGVKFEYSNHRVVSGYHKAKGDCTIRSGQHLKIGYVYYGKEYGNIIVYIEQLP